MGIHSIFYVSTNESIFLVILQTNYLFLQFQFMNLNQYHKTQGYIFFRNCWIFLKAFLGCPRAELLGFGGAKDHLKSMRLFRKNMIIINTFIKEGCIFNAKIINVSNLIPKILGKGKFRLW